MITMQVQFTEEQDRQLREIARQENLSVAEVVRRCVDRTLVAEQPARAALYERAARIVGSLTSEETDLTKDLGDMGHSFSLRGGGRNLVVWESTTRLRGATSGGVVHRPEKR